MMHGDDEEREAEVEEYTCSTKDKEASSNKLHYQRTPIPIREDENESKGVVRYVVGVIESYSSGLTLWEGDNK